MTKRYLQDHGNTLANRKRGNEKSDNSRGIRFQDEKKKKGEGKEELKQFENH